MSITLSPRLAAAANRADPTAVVADIGTDHGYIPIYLVKEKGVRHVIATDANEDPLNKARRIVQRFKLEAHITLRLGNGLEVLEPGEATTLILAGMGGTLITELLEASPMVAHQAQQLILQPVQAVPVLRRYLAAHGYRIHEEVLIQEKHRFYEIMVAKYENLPVHEPEPVWLETGSFLKQQPATVARAFVSRKIRLFTQKYQGLSQADPPDPRQLSETRALIEALKEELRWLKQ
ncbi:tRNA (adenine(22)-N(1))-methyltransferase [Anoxynatronum buryatiense]|uniref:tRNA (Adenine22-N1)-methyltransferase n=1 Tax=Anoxynatronum buryatiense TaxID=489973 RepID=A0AA45WSS8_9CLOT|nr:class I SAM-dependent methyltransferase [Anoxynatronum buryatiense]SMP39312.1 tRNA (adenine22-N1)-methyltransferase [Anoxynatronum buryatiense]